MAFLGEEMDLDPYDEDEFFISIGLGPTRVGGFETPGTRALQGLPSILGQIAGRADEMGRDYSEYDEIEFDPVTDLPVYDPTNPVIFEQTVQMPDQEVGGGGPPRRPATTTTTTPITGTTTGGLYDVQQAPRGGGIARQIRGLGGKIIDIPEGVNLVQYGLELLGRGAISRAMYKGLTGEDAPSVDDATPPDDVTPP